ncbi:MAG: ATP-binding protein [Deltaproteobacteria bacterium]|nr:ATP-binding protein [Deltaproteobacteria bacterium]
MIRRWLGRLVRERLSRFPAVALVGARQVGKTTLARALGGAYFDLEQPEDRVRLDLDFDGLARGARLVVLDEAQAWPAVFPRLRGAIDADRRRNGRFLLLGSVSPGLMREVSESLAGRLSVCELTPLLALELPERRQDELWLMGGYPDGGILAPGRFPRWQEDYLTLLAQRDLPLWGLPATHQTTGRLFKMVAARHGSVWNASELGRSLGLNYHTVDTYLDYLEGAFLVRRLQAFHRNIGKRLVKRPKVYWRDPGLLHALLGTTTRDELLAAPWVGASWEGWVVEQVLSHLTSRGIAHEAFFLRTHDGHEVDLVLDARGQRWCIEIKLSSSPSPGDFERLAVGSEWAGATRQVVVSRTQRTIDRGPRLSTNLRGLLGRLAEDVGARHPGA